MIASFLRNINYIVITINVIITSRISGWDNRIGLVCVCVCVCAPLQQFISLGIRIVRDNVMMWQVHQYCITGKFREFEGQAISRQENFANLRREQGANIHANICSLFSPQICKIRELFLHANICCYPAFNCLAKVLWTVPDEELDIVFRPCLVSQVIPLMFMDNAGSSSPAPSLHW